MNIDLKPITVRELVDGYHDDGDDGVRGYGGKLGRFFVNGKGKYVWIVVRRRNET